MLGLLKTDDISGCKFVVDMCSIWILAFGDNISGMGLFVENSVYPQGILKTRGCLWTSVSH